MRAEGNRRPYDILVFGDTCVDLILRDDDMVPRFGQVERLVANYDLVMGGSCCIFAAQAAKLGLRVALLGVVGADQFGQVIHDTLGAAGVDTSLLRVDPDKRTGLTVHLVQGGDRAMLTHLGSLNALTAADVTDDVLSAARHLHYGSLYLHTGLLPDWVDILRRAKRLGLTVSLDTNWDPDEKWDVGLERALAHIDVLLPNEQEACCLSGQPDFAAAIAHLRQRVPLLVVKRAAAGATVWMGEREIVQSVAPAGRAGTASAPATASTRVSWPAGWRNCPWRSASLSLADAGVR